MDVIYIIYLFILVLFYFFNKLLDKFEHLTLNREDCFKECNREKCIQMFEMDKYLNSCLKCNSQKNKCFDKSIIGGLCNDCNGTEEKNKIDCYNIANFGCKNIKNIRSDIGVSPYYINVENIKSSYDSKCVFCWNI